MRRADKQERQARPLHPSGAPRSLNAAGRAGTNKLSFAGRMSAQSKLKSGRYKLAVGATAFGLAATSLAISFTIVS